MADYYPLGDRGPLEPAAAHPRKRWAVLGLVSAGGLLYALTPSVDSALQIGNRPGFRPASGVEDVVVDRDGNTNLHLAEGLFGIGAPSAIFYYSPKALPRAITQGATAEEARVYGAALPSYLDNNGQTTVLTSDEVAAMRLIACPTGNQEDKLKGYLLRWDSSSDLKARLELTERIVGYNASDKRERESRVRRGVVKAVRMDGSWQKAYWFFLVKGSSASHSQSFHYVRKSAKIYPPFPNYTAQIVFSAGCFWNIEKGFWRLPGVYTTAAG
eukprot:g27303.t1